MAEEFSLQRLKEEIDEAGARLVAARSLKAAADADLAAKESERVKARADAEAALDGTDPTQHSAGVPVDIDRILERSHEAEAAFQEASITLSKAAAQLLSAETAYEIAKIGHEEGKKIEEAHSEYLAANLAHDESLPSLEERHQREERSLFLQVGLLSTVIGATALSIVGGTLYLILRKPAEVTPVLRMKGEPLGLDASSAQVFCSENIKRVAKDPETAKVPFVRAQNSSETHDFIWGPGTSMVRMRNGLGAEVAVQATCSVSKSTGRIVTLIVDGKQVLPGM